MKCPHHPRCITTCRRCGAPLPKLPKRNKKISRQWYVITYETDCTNHELAANADEAEMLSNIMLCRAAGLCLDHLARVAKVELRNGQ